MKPPPFRYHDPKTVSEAVGLLGSLENAKLLAGGQSLMPMLNMRFVLPDHIIDLNRVEGLSYIREAKGALEIGAMTRQRDLEFSDAVCARWPIMHEALLQVGHRQTRNRGTIGGSLCHLDPAAELVSLATGYDATVTVVGPKGQRDVPFAQFPVAYMTPAIEPNELVVGVRFPLWPKRRGLRFHGFRPPAWRLRHHLGRRPDRCGCRRQAQPRLGDDRRHGNGAGPRARARAGAARTGADQGAVPRRLRELPQTRSDRRRARAGVLSPAPRGGAVAAGPRAVSRPPP